MPLEYLCYCWVMSLPGWTEWDFWAATTDFIFGALEFAHVEHVTRRFVRYGRPIVEPKRGKW